MEPLYHITTRREWLEANKANSYSVSTLGKSLSEVGFIHLSFAHQVKMVADLIYICTTDLVLLKIDSEKLTSPVKIEALDGNTELFPHLYGLLNIDAVQNVSEYKTGLDSKFPSIND